MLFLLQTFKYCATTDRQPIRVEPYVDINQLDYTINNIWAGVQG
jgi:hypothetical protein